ncbi:uncharacterized protein LOC116298939 isoform X2 [Actinia tenebrosa]|nr:uncharacterized protein LOC116298939 isoform X2 [Actinia tenebrosa]
MTIYKKGADSKAKIILNRSTSGLVRTLRSDIFNSKLNMNLNVKLSIWLYAITSFTLLVDSLSIKNDYYAYINEDEALERAMPLNEPEFGVEMEEMDSKEDSTCTNGTFTICKPITASKILGVLKQLGVRQNPAIRIAKVSKRFLRELKMNNGTLKATQRKRRSSNNYSELCEEKEVVMNFQLIHPKVSLLYVVRGVTCVNKFCFSQYCAPDNPIGKCILTKSQVFLHLFDDYGTLCGKTLEVGVA